MCVQTINLLALILSPVIAVCIGELLRRRTYYKQQRDDLVRRLIKFGYQMSSTHRGEKEEILGALNEVKYWYSANSDIKKLTFSTMDKMKGGQNAQDKFIELIQKIALEEGHSLSREDIERVFSTKS